MFRLTFALGIFYILLLTSLNAQEGQLFVRVFHYNAGRWCFTL